MLNKVKSIIIFGGGTSGWMAAAYISKNLNFKADITLIEDTATGPIGVGEGTQPATSPFLWDCGLKPTDWMGMCDATYKYGVELVGWCNEPYFVDNDVEQNSLISDGFYTNHYFQNKPYSEYKNFLPAYQLAKQNISPKKGNFDNNFGSSAKHNGAFHFNAFKIVEALKSVCINKITHIDARIKDVVTDENGIRKLIDDANVEYTADLYIDCSGFSSILLDKNLKEPFESYNDILLCDSAVALPTQYKNPTTECHPYTKATTMTSGWRWTIPTFSRIGNGYVYSSKFITPEQAEKELREALNCFDGEARHLKIRCGKHKRIAVKNVVAVGLSAGFIEPLEATGITFTTHAIQALTQGLNNTGNVLSEKLRDFVNLSFDVVTTEILAFVWAHYKFSSRSDTDFWKAVHAIEIENLPEKAKNIIEHLLSGHPYDYRLTYYSMFSVPQWFSMLHAGNAYENKQITLTADQEEYGKYFCNVQKERLKIVMNTFGNHYDYLKDRYNANNV